MFYDYSHSRLAHKTILLQLPVATILITFCKQSRSILRRSGAAGLVQGSDSLPRAVCVGDAGALY